MLTVTVQKDIGEYEEKVVLGLTLKRLIVISICVGLAIAEAVVGMFVFGINVQDLAIPIFATAAVGFVIGYLEPMGMPFLEAAPYLIRQNFGNNQLEYVSAGEMALEKDRENEKHGKVSHVRKEEIKEYKRIRGYRDERSAELLVPRYYEARREVEEGFGVPDTADDEERAA